MSANNLKLNLTIKQLSEHYDYLAPDTSEIRLLPEVRGGGFAHCTLLPGGLSEACTHKTVDEIWYCLQGRGEVWRKLCDQEQVDTVGAGASLTIPLGTHFQFRNTGDEPLCILIATIPPWPGPDEAQQVAGYWPLGSKSEC